LDFWVFLAPGTLLARPELSSVLGFSTHLGGYAVNQDLGDYFRFADDTPSDAPTNKHWAVT
jgi:hypothetical protein